MRFATSLIRAVTHTPPPALVSALLTTAEATGTRNALTPVGAVFSRMLVFKAEQMTVMESAFLTERHLRRWMM
jgi:hypothetical protein